MHSQAVKMAWQHSITSTTPYNSVSSTHCCFMPGLLLAKLRHSALLYCRPQKAEQANMKVYLHLACV